jgi:hypothetical protein
MPNVESATAGRRPRSDAWQSAVTVVQEVAPPSIVIHYQDGNHRDDIPLRFTVTMLCEPGQPIVTDTYRERLAAAGEA